MRTIKDYFLALIYCQHNARIIADFEDRMSSVIYAATDRMSKPYYSKEAMLAEIKDAQDRLYQDAYEEGQSDVINVPQAHPAPQEATQATTAMEADQTHTCELRFDGGAYYCIYCGKKDPTEPSKKV